LTSQIACHASPWSEDLASALTEIREAGYDAIETFCLSHYFDKIELFQETLSAAGLPLIAMEYGGEWLPPERQDVEWDGAERLVRFLSALGARTFVVSGGRLLAGGARMEDYAALAEIVNRLGHECHQNHLQLCFHPKRRTLIEFRDQIGLLMDATDPEAVGLCLDTGEQALSGCDPLELVKSYGARIRHVHLKDLDWQTHRPTAPGKGALELAFLIAEFMKAGYTGSWTVELEGSRSPLDDARKARAFLQGILR
jgi:inosose dehydratase